MKHFSNIFLVKYGLLTDNKNFFFGTDIVNFSRIGLLMPKIFAQKVLKFWRTSFVLIIYAYDSNNPTIYVNYKSWAFMGIVVLENFSGPIYAPNSCWHLFFPGWFDRHICCKWNNAGCWRGCNSIDAARGKLLPINI